jgi:hypothetical protein
MLDLRGILTTLNHSEAVFINRTNNNVNIEIVLLEKPLVFTSIWIIILIALHNSSNVTFLGRNRLSIKIEKAIININKLNP